MRGVYTKMKICFFNGDMSRGGGTERVTALIANKLQEKKANLEIIVLSFRNKTKTSFFRLNKEVKHDILIDNEVNKVTIVYSIKKLTKYLKNNKIDILVNVDIMLGIYSIPAKIFSKTKLISWEQFSFYDDIGSKYTKYVRAVSVRLCNYYIVLTEADKKNFLKNLNVKCPIKYIYNPIEQNNINTYNLNSKIIMSAGNIVEVKGFDMVIEIGERIFKNYPEWKWYIYGDGPGLIQLQENIIKHNLENNIILGGRVKDIEKYYKEAAIFVLTSRKEGFGLVLIEAGAYGIPSIAFNVPEGPVEIIVNKENGFLVKPFDIEEMSERILELIRNKTLRAEMSRVSKQRALQFDIDIIIKQWEDVFEEVIDNGYYIK